MEELAAAGNVPGGSLANLEYVSEKVNWGDEISGLRQRILCDAQTSGGLLIAAPEQYAMKMVQEMTLAGIEAVAIGRIVSAGSGTVRVR